MNAAATNPRIARAVREVPLDDLLGRKVLAKNGRPVGRLEEFRVEVHRGEYTVAQYVIGAAGLLERLGVAMKLLLGRKRGGYAARWDQIDVSDPDRLRLTCEVEELETF
jgi:sporulation protein YlmC with PRC-barrel domain